MKKYRKFSQILTLIVVLSTIMFSCVNDEYDTPPITQLPIGNVYTIAQIKDSIASVSTYKFEKDASVYATVTMDNETDNCYRTFYIQDNTSAIAVFQNVSGGVYIGDSVRIYLKDLVVMKYSELFQINTVAGTGIDVDANLVKQGYNNKRVPENTTVAAILANPTYWQGRLAKISDVQFVSSDTSKTYANAPEQITENRYIQDSIGNLLLVRTSGYATFAGLNVPNGSGSIIAIIGQYNNDLQLYIRKSSEVVMENVRFDIGGGGNIDPTGSGTFEDPFNVIKAIQNNTGTDLWVQGYIVGVYETVDAGGSPLSEFAPSFTAPFNTNSNLIIADSEDETNISNCVVVQLPAGDIRTPLNLVDHVANKGKMVKVLGDLMPYFGAAGVKNTSGYWMDGTGVVPEVGFYEEDFASSISAYTAFSVTGAQAWVYATYDNGCAKMSGYAGTNNANEDWLVSPVIDLSAKTNVTLVIREAINYITTYDDIQILVSTDYDGTSNASTQGTWIPLTGMTRPVGNSWDFASSGDYDLSAYDGEATFYIAFKYISSASAGATWEIGNVLLKENVK